MKKIEVKRQKESEGKGKKKKYDKQNRTNAKFHKFPPKMWTIL